MIRWLGLAVQGREERRLEAADEIASRRLTIEAGLRRIDELASAAELPAQIVAPIRAHHFERLRQLDYRIGADAQEQRLAEQSDELERWLIDAEREHLYELMCEGKLKDDARRRIENELDLREAQLRHTTPRSGHLES